MSSNFRSARISSEYSVGTSPREGLQWTAENRQVAKTHASKDFRAARSSESQEKEKGSAKAYAGAILGRAPFIKDVLKRIADMIPKNEAAQRRALSSTLDLDEVIRFLSRHFTIPEDAVARTPPYRSYALYLAKKHTLISGADIGRYFNITCSAVAKMGTRLKHRLEQDKALRDQMRRIEKGLSHVKGDPQYSMFSMLCIERRQDFQECLRKSAHGHD